MADIASGAGASAIQQSSAMDVPVGSSTSTTTTMMSEVEVPGEEERHEILSHSLAWLFGHGFAMIPPTREPGHMMHIPFALLPRKMPLRALTKAYDLAVPFNILVDRIARDPKWISSVLGRTGNADPFTGRLLKLMEKLYLPSSISSDSSISSPTTTTVLMQPLMLGLHRSDYMLDQRQQPSTTTGTAGSSSPSSSSSTTTTATATDPRILQVEINTISSSFGCLSSRVSEMHAWLGTQKVHGVVQTSTATTATTHEEETDQELQNIDPATPVAAARYFTRNKTALREIKAAMNNNNSSNSRNTNSLNTGCEIDIVSHVAISKSRDGLARGLAGAHEAYLQSPLRRPFLTTTREATTSSPTTTQQQQPIVAFIVQTNERNVQDQRQLEYALLNSHGIRSRRLTLSQITQYSMLSYTNPAAAAAAAASFNSSNGNTAAEIPTTSPKALWIPTYLPSSSSSSTATPPTPTVSWQEVSVVYFRAGYTPDDYTASGEEEWNAREIIELSSAVKCPSLPYHLAGTKKIQQALASPGVLERFFPTSSSSPSSSSLLTTQQIETNKSMCAMIRSCFAGLWSLDEKEIASDAYAQQAIQDAKKKPERYVIKPQREGGGNNLYNQQVAAALSSTSNSNNNSNSNSAEGHMTAEELSAYILMERIFPPTTPTCLVRAGQIIIADCVSELGVYGVFLGTGSGGNGGNGDADEKNKGDGALLNYAAGHLLRTKSASTDEGGVAAGFAVLDSVLVV